MTITRVLNLSTQQELIYTCTPIEAVMAAYAQVEKKDYNTWDYYVRYADLVVSGKHSVSCGDWCALLQSKKGINCNDKNIGDQITETLSNRM